MNAKPNPKARKPIEIKRGNVSVKIYTGANRMGERVYPQFTLAYYSGNRRIKRRFADLEEAKREAELAATKLANGENDVLKHTSNDRAVYLQATRMLEPLNLSLHCAVSEYVHAATRLPQGVTVREAVDFFLRRNPANLGSKTVREVIEEMIATKSQAGRSDIHLQDMESRLGRFAEAFQMNIGQVTGPMIQAHLDGMKVSGRTRRNHLRLISSLFRFAVKRKHLPKDALEELEAVEWPEVTPTETLIFTPDELREMLQTARPELRPALAIAAFCGLRTAEITRLDWAQVNLERRFVEVKAQNAKTASRRLVPLCDAAIAWLTPCRASEGRVAYFAEENKFCSTIVESVNEARREAGSKEAFLWKKNALRHSFCSYRMALTHDAAKTALEAGNSPQMIFKHYRELVTEDEAKVWFTVQLEGEPNIVAMPAAA